MPKLTTSIAAMFLVKDNDGIGYFCHPEYGLLSMNTFSVNIGVGVWCTLLVHYTKRDSHNTDYNVRVLRMVGVASQETNDLIVGFSHKVEQAQNMWASAVAYVFRADTLGAFGWSKDLGLVQVSDKPQHDTRYWAKGFVRLNQKFLSNPKEFMAKSKVQLTALWCFNGVIEKKAETDIQLSSNGIYIGTGVVKQTSANVYNVEVDKSMTPNNVTVENLTIEVRNSYTAVPVGGLSDQLDCSVVAAVLDSADGRSMFALQVAITISGVLVDDTHCWQKQVGLLPISGSIAQVGQLVTAEVDKRNGQNAAFWRVENVRPFEAAELELKGRDCRGVRVGGYALVIELANQEVTLWNQYTGKVVVWDLKVNHNVGSVVTFDAIRNRPYQGGSSTDSSTIPYWYTKFWFVKKSSEFDMWKIGQFQDLLVMRGEVAPARVGANKKTLFGYHGLQHVKDEKPNEVVCYVGVGSLSSQSFDSLKFGDKVWLFCYKGVSGKFVAVSVSPPSKDILLG